MKYVYRVLSGLTLLLSISLVSCTQNKETEIADQIWHSGVIHTVDKDTPLAEAIAIKGDRILYVGTTEDAMNYKGETTTLYDLKGRTVIPGLIESHGHMMGMGYNELNIDLLDTRSYDELLNKVRDAVAKARPGEWIIGRGWHQSKWDPQPEMIKGFPTHDRLSEISPDNPVLLRHASGHASMANAKAMELAGVNPLSVESNVEEVEGGEIIRDEEGNPTGIFNERAQGIIGALVPENTLETDIKALELAVAACQRYGITGFHDAGTGQATIDLYKSFVEQGKLGTRMYVMVSGPDRELTKKWLENGPLIDTTDYLLTVRSIKLNCDGALGSRGAWLLEEYSDRPGHFGMATLPMEYVGEIAKKGLERGFQVCSHAIGDRANREVLDRYEAAFNEMRENLPDHRYRIEHAQHIDPADLPRFAKMNVIAAVQAIHMSSDRPWAIDRLGEKRIVEGAYMWQTLLASGAVVCNGTDVPVEPLNPFASIYASITRKTLEGTPESGYEPAERMTRAQALESYTLACAYASFEEDAKGSITKGKLADIVVLDRDIMTVDEKEIPDTKVLVTVLGGKIVFGEAGNL